MPNTTQSASFTLLDFHPQLRDLYLGDATVRE
jgi:hypothetical protein